MDILFIRIKPYKSSTISHNKTVEIIEESLAHAMHYLLLSSHVTSQEGTSWSVEKPDNTRYLNVTRQTANRAIILKIARYIEENPDQRFGQILRNIGVIIDFQRPPRTPEGWNEVEWMNHFNEESDKMLERMNKLEKEKT